MSHTALLDAGIWRDPALERLSNPTRYLALYLMTSPEGNALGLYALSPSVALTDTGLTKSLFESAMDDLKQSGFVMTDDQGVVFIPSKAKLIDTQTDEGLQIGRECLDQLPSESRLISALMVIHPRLFAEDGVAPKPAKPGHRFAEFWAAWPSGYRTTKKAAYTKWVARGLDKIADRIIADVENRKQMDGRWIDGYIPNPVTYINGDRWEDEVTPDDHFGGQPMQSKRSNRSTQSQESFDEATPGNHFGGQPMQSKRSNRSTQSQESFDEVMARIMAGRPSPYPTFSGVMPHDPL